MAYKEDEYHSLKLTKFFMKLVGFWKSDNRREKIMLDIRLTYTVSAILFAIAVESVDLFYCWGDFDAVVYNACASMPLVLVLVKLTVFIIKRDIVVNLISFSEKNFWKVGYNDFGKQIMRECERKGVLLIFSFTFLVSGTIFTYLLAPIVENIGRDPSDRVLPFKLWVNLPLTVSPYYEITFVIQALSTIHSGICFFCFDNLLCIFTIHAAGQFKILQNRFTSMCQKSLEIDNTKDLDPTNDITGSEIFLEFESCINKHRTLISFIETVEGVFTFILLCQMLVSSLHMCLSGFQVFLADLNILRRLIFVSHVLASLTQLFLFTSTCNEIIVESVKVGDAAYHCKWYTVSHQKIGMSLKRGLMIVMARVQHPCFLSAGKFCPMSLQAFTSILRTALSYFTLLRQMSEDVEK